MEDRPAETGQSGIDRELARVLPWEAAIHVFDVDHTLVRRSTGRRFAQTLVRSGYLKNTDLLMLPWHYLRYRLGDINAGAIAGRLAVIRGLPEEVLRDAANTAFAGYMTKDIYKQARRYLETLTDLGRTVVLASTSVRMAVEPLARSLKIEHVLASELEFYQGSATGNLVGEPCYGPHKVAKVGSLLESLGRTFEETAFYSDSIHDRFLLQAVGYPVAVHPDPRLRAMAQSYRWPAVFW